MSERKIYSSARQGPNNTISNLTAPSLEVPRKVPRASTLTRGTAVPIAQRGIQTKQIISKSYNTYRNSTTGTNEGSHQEPREAPNSRGKKSEEDQNPTVMYSKNKQRKNKEKTAASER